MSKRLENKTAVITGGTTGLGFETAKLYLQEGISL
jgi:NAD(P)-dependent dehydrogenase (short-subunit alcohol dehydrogenase family)